MIVSLPVHEARRLEAREGEGLHVLLQRHAVLQAERDGDGEVVHQAAEGGAFLVHVDEDLAEPAVLVLARVQVDLVAADGRLLRVALAPVGQLLALRCVTYRALDDPLDDALRSGSRAQRSIGLSAWSCSATSSCSSASSARSCELSGWVSLEPSR